MRGPQEDDMVPALQFFEERGVRRTDLSGVGEWRQWSEGLGDENDGVSSFALVLCFRARVTRLSFFLSSLISWISNSEVK